MKPESLRPLIRSGYYSNILMVSRDGEHLSTVNTKRANWYLNKDLAIEITPPSPYPRAIQLKFAHHKDTAVQETDLEMASDKCCICGQTWDLSIHHVIPKVIRQHFPVKDKIHKREWCVILCIECHSKVEAAIQPIYKEKFPNSAYLTNKKILDDMLLHDLKSRGLFSKISPERIQFLLRDSSYKSIDEIPNIAPPAKNEKANFLSKIHQEEIKNWADQFIQTHGGINGTTKFFAKLFMDFNPQHIPSAYEKRYKSLLDID